jgi:glycosyltransferase involved in cell wall biosynthesis
LVKAYSEYRRNVSNPWGLTCCGTGEERKHLDGIPGVVDAGFTPPKDLPTLFRQHGAFVLVSRFEPWGVVVAEAAASGLPVICSSACGAGMDVVRPYFNGIVVAAGDVAGFAHAMRWVHEHEADLPSMSRKGQALAEPYSAEAWASRWHNYFLELMSAVSLGKA